MDRLLKQELELDLTKADRSEKLETNLARFQIPTKKYQLFIGERQQKGKIWRKCEAV